MLRSRLHRAAATILATAILSLVPAAADVSWRSGARSEPRPAAPAELEEALDTLAEREAHRRVVIHFDTPLGADRRELLAAAGVRLLGYLGGNAYFANLTPGLDTAGVSVVPGLLQVEAIALESKLHTDLARGIVRPWSVVEPAKENADEGAAASPRVAVYVLFHPDVDLDATAPRVVGRHGGSVRSWMRSIHGVVVHLRASRVDSLAAEDDVMWVEPPLPQLSPLNDSNRVRVGADTLQQLPYGLDGSGVTVLVYDAGKMQAHPDFGNRLTIGPSDTDSISDHATHVGGTIGGDGGESGGVFRGMAPAVEFVSYGFEQEGGLQEGFLYTDPGDLEADYTEAISLGADVSNNSIGTNTAPNGFPCEWEGNYGATGALIDAIARGSLGAPFRIVWANGNERSSGACGSTYLTTAPPACAKNHITVGAMNSNDDSVTSFTSWGPTDDGRIKPDVSAPGCESGSDGGVTSTSSSGGYNVKCGTSMASPTVAGISALMLQQYRLSFPGEPDPRNSTMKAILAQTAADLVTPGPDYQTGYGSVRAVPAVDLIQEGRFIENEVGQGQVYSFIVIVGPGDPELKVTLSWDDPPGTPNVNPVLVNDLDLRVIDGGGTVHFPWTLDPSNPADPAVRTVADHANNIEQVVIDAPAPGAYRVEIEGFNVALGPTQTFGVAAGPTLINCAPAGFVATGGNRISCEALLDLQVVDCDLNTDDGVAETTTVDVSSDSEIVPETVTLTENAPESAAFVGSIQVSETDATGVLMVSEGDTIAVTYVDADDGEGGTNVPVVRNVVVDCTPPVVSSVTVTDVQPRDATVAIATDEPVTVSLSYGLSCAALTDTIVKPTLDANHEVQILGLEDDTAYFFTVELTDEAGNVTSDDNGGECYGFVTPEVPDFFTEQFSTGIDLGGQVATFMPVGTVDQYSQCIEPLGGQLPTDPAGGTDLGLGDDQPTSFTLADGASVVLYGVAYDTVYVGPNGYLTFGDGDSTYNESLIEHFSLPRVAALFDDLNPGSAGSVSWKQTSDRVAVTWQGVPEYQNTNDNTFQIEMFFDGRIRISWLSVESSDAVVGLSGGLGVDPDFLPSDLSNAGACGPHAPFAQSEAVQTDVDQPVGVTLVAMDDDLPAPPSLTYRIVTLPAAGSLTDGRTGRAIAFVPYDLGPGNDLVTYTPVTGFQGEDSFQFVADDGGVPPEGGESNPAVISVTVGGPQVIYAFLVDDTDPNWGTRGDWAFGQPTGGGSHNNDPSSGATGDNVYGYNLDGDYPNNMGQEPLTSGVLDLSQVSGTYVEFQRWLGVESSTYDHATFQVSVDGVNWSTVWNHGGSAISDSSWQLMTYDISGFVDGEPMVQLRWVMGSTDGSVTYPGWNIDDIRVWGITSSVPDCQGAPDEATGLVFQGDKQTLAWQPPANPNGVSVEYDVLRSPTSRQFTVGMVCVESDDGADLEAFDPVVPADGRVHYYVVRPQNSCGLGPLGQDSSGVERTGLDCN